MTVHAYYLLADPEQWDDSEDGYDQAETSLDLELSNKMDVIDYMLIDDEYENPPYIAY